MIALSDIAEAPLFVHPGVIGAEVELAESGAAGVFGRTVEQQPSVGVSAHMFGDIEGADPRSQVHAADKVIGDQPCTTDRLAARHQQIPLRKRTCGADSVADAVLIKNGRHFGPAGRNIADRGIREFGVLPDGDDFHGRTVISP